MRVPKSALAIPLLLTAAILSLAGCRDTPCTSDAECGAGERCVALGGIVFGGSICVATDTPDDPDQALADTRPSDVGGSSDLADAFHGDGDGDAGTDAADLDLDCDPVTQIGRQCDPVVEARIGGDGTCLRRESGAVACWGGNWGGSAGDGSGEGRVVPTPSLVVAPADQAGSFRAKSVCPGGWGFSCGVDVSGDLYCWGWGRNLGIGADEVIWSINATPQPLQSEDPDFEGVAFERVVCGQQSACAIDSQGGLWCWGEPNGGATNPSAPDQWGAGPARVDLPAAVTSATIGRSTACAVVDSGDVYCWGTDEKGNLGFDAGSEQPVGPSQVGLPSSAAEVSSTIHSVCARLEDRRAFCWGELDWIVGEPLQTITPTEVVIPGGVDEIGVGYRAACARSAEQVYCWGERHQGHLGDGVAIAPGPSPPPLTPRLVDSIPPIDRLFVTRHGVCAISEGVPWCWGMDTSDQLLQNAKLLHAQPVEVQLPAGTLIAEFVGSDGGVAILSTRNEIVSWGKSAPGLPRALGAHHVGTPTVVDIDLPIALGNGSWDMLAATIQEVYRLHRSTEEAPVTVEEGLGEVVEVAASHEETCWVSDSGADLSCDHPEREQGDTLPQVSVLRSGGTHFCAKESPTRSLLCWGQNRFSQLGNGTSSSDYSRTPEAVDGLGPISEFAIGVRHGCAVQDPDNDGEGTVACWGLNTYGQIGVPPAVDSRVRVPRTVTLPRDAIDVAVGEWHSCAVLTNEEVWCWGSNRAHQAGGSETSHAAARVDAITATSVYADGDTSYAVDAADPEKLWCWGIGADGRCGTGAPNYSATPAPLSDVGPAIE